MHLFDVIFLPNFLVRLYPMISTPQFSYLLSSNTLPQLRAIICFRVIEMVIVIFFRYITHGVHILMQATQIDHYLCFL